jgi:ADP-ribosylglycohydrolase
VLLCSSTGDPDRVSTRLAALLELFRTRTAAGSTLTDADLIDVSGGGDYFCVHSLVMVIGLWAAERPSFRTVSRAALIGGDTDSNAAMVGALVGGLRGRSGLISADLRSENDGDADRAGTEYLSALSGCDGLIGVGERFGTAL